MRRLVSLVPSITETLCAFGLQKEVVGCTSFCSHPHSLRHTAASVGGTKDAQAIKILALKPTHVFVNEEENPPALIARLQEAAAQQGFLLHVSYPRDVADAMTLVSDIGVLLEFQEAAQAWRAKCTEALRTLRARDDSRRQRAQEPLRYAYFIWRNPWMVAGNRTYISSLLGEAGFVNAFSTSDNPRERYPIVSPTEPPFDDARLALFFSSEPFPFRKRHIEELQAARKVGFPREDFFNPQCAELIRKVDGRLLSWYGVCTLAALSYLEELHREFYPS